MGDMTDQTETDRSRAPQAHPAVPHAPRHFAPRWRYYIGMVTVLACMALLFLPCSAYTIEFPGPTGNVLGKVSKAKNAKDMAAGAVLVVSLFAALTGALIFLPRIWDLLF